jgi:hypothetical protein
MISRPQVSVKSSPRHDRYDVLIAALGYEGRASYIAQQIGDDANQRVAFSFESASVLSFDANVAAFEQLGFVIHPLSDEDWQNRILHFIEESGGLGMEGDGCKIAIDISCFTRFHLAVIVDYLVTLGATNPLSVDFLYAPASSKNWEIGANTIQIADPIHPAFVSWADDPSWPLTAVIGVGAEDGLALGVAEYLDVSSVYAFVPYGSDAGFDDLSENANRQFFVEDYVVRRSPYDVLEPFELFSRLESLVYGLSDSSRVALIPLGPKIFALCALLVCVASDEGATVWRFSNGTNLPPVQREAAGAILSLRVEINGRQSGENAD